MIKTGLSYKRNPINESFDAIVIGSGIGGLMAAVCLSEFAGKKVLVLERHYVAGGYTHSFERPGYDWDVGVHYIGDVLEPNSDTRRAFDFLTGGQLQWASMGDVYDRIVIGDATFDYVAGRENFRQRMYEYFPAQKNAIDGYLTAVRDALAGSKFYFVDKALPAVVSAVAGPFIRRKFYRWSDRTTADVLQQITPDPMLRAVLAGQYGDYGLPPSQSSFAIHAMVVNHYLEGGAYPVGGASVIAAGAAAVLAKNGGKILINAEVQQVLLQNNRAIGVVLADSAEVRAPLVISDAGVFNTYNKLLPAEACPDIRAKLRQSLTPSLGHLCLYLGLNKTSAELDLPKANYWLYPDADHDKNFAAFSADPQARFPVVYISFPSAKDPDFERRHPGHAAIDVITMAKASWFSEWQNTKWKKRGDAYEATKQAFSQRLLEHVYKYVPKAKAALDVAELSTPLTTRHFCNYDQGEIYGLDHTPARFRNRLLRPQTPIKGLYLTGQDICTAGVAGALFGGVLCASAITGRDLMSAAVKRGARH